VTLDSSRLRRSWRASLRSWRTRDSISRLPRRTSLAATGACARRSWAYSVSSAWSGSSPRMRRPPMTARRRIACLTRMDEGSGSLPASVTRECDLTGASAKCEEKGPGEQISYRSLAQPDFGVSGGDRGVTSAEDA
jgi:hypothetical protein